MPFKEKVTKEEWSSVHSTVLSEAKLDDPIKIWDWAILIKMILDPDEGKSGPMLDMYVYGLFDGEKLTREDAVGGLVKLLTLKHLRGSSTAEELKASLQLRDLDTISERQRTLVQMAYCQGILDSQTIDEFCPGHLLTNGEAVSILNRVYNKFLLTKEQLAGIHWAEKGLANFADSAAVEEYRHTIIKEITASQALDKPIKVKQWHDLLIDTHYSHITASIQRPQLITLLDWQTMST